MATTPESKSQSLALRWDMQHEKLRLQYRRLVEAGEPLTFESAMKLHRETFKAGAEAMADAIHEEQGTLQLAAAEEAARLEKAGHIIRPDFWGATGGQTVTR